jgi:3-oxoacyl-[acyl-carrier-protein] synthase III
MMEVVEPTKITLRLGAAPVRISGCGLSFPPHDTSSAELLDSIFPDLPERRRQNLLDMVEREIGVRRRAHVGPSEIILPYALCAAKAALREAGNPALIAHVHATSTASRWTGPESARIGQALGLSCAMFDVRGGCTGGLWALMEGARLARDGRGPVLVSAADALSLTLPASDRTARFAIGDGAVAFVLEPASEGGLLRGVLGGDPSGADFATVRRELPHGMGPFDQTLLAEEFAEATERGIAASLDALEAPTDMLHAIHARRDVAERLRQHLWLETLRNHGMVGAASSLIALAELRAQPQSTRSVVLAGAGGGVGFGAALWQLEERR